MYRSVYRASLCALCVDTLGVSTHCVYIVTHRVLRWQIMLLQTLRVAIVALTALQHLQMMPILKILVCRMNGLMSPTRFLHRGWMRPWKGHYPKLKALILSIHSFVSLAKLVCLSYEIPFNIWCWRCGRGSVHKTLFLAVGTFGFMGMLRLFASSSRLRRGMAWNTTSEQFSDKPC